MDQVSKSGMSWMLDDISDLFRTSNTNTCRWIVYARPARQIKSYNEDLILALLAQPEVDPVVLKYQACRPVLLLVRGVAVVSSCCRWYILLSLGAAAVATYCCRVTSDATVLHDCFENRHPQTTIGSSTGIHSVHEGPNPSLPMKYIVYMPGTLLFVAVSKFNPTISGLETKSLLRELMMA